MTKPKYNINDIENALHEIQRGISITAAAKKYKIPRSTLAGKHFNIYPINMKKGPSSVLSAEEEDQLKKWIFSMSDARFPVTPAQLIDSVQRLVVELKRKTPFTDGRPGRKWYKSFMQRHSDIKLKLSRNLSYARARVSEENIRAWFKDVQSYLERENLSDLLNDPTRIFNADETGFLLSPEADHVLVRKNSKMVYTRINNDEKECITALIGGNAAGKVMPTMVVYSYQRIPALLTELFPSTWAIGRTENGWMTAETFYEYIANIFHPWLVKEKIKLPVLLFVDGHTSHMSMHLSEFCQKNLIVLVALFPNSTHFMQPMDVSAFHPLKAGWKTGVRNWRYERNGISLRRENFAPLLNQVKFVSYNY